MDNPNIERKANSTIAVSEDDLARAFIGKPISKSSTKKPRKSGKSKLMILSIVFFVIGLLVLAVGVVVFVLGNIGGRSLEDADFLTQTSAWVLDSEQTNCASSSPVNEEALDVDSTATNCESMEKVIWKFTEIGKGTLTTNNYLDTYDFIWSIEDNILKIETKWLYDLINEYEYHLDQNQKTLTLKDDSGEYVLVGQFAETE